MNLSGESAALFLRQKSIQLNNIMVVADDIALQTGTIRIRPSGSAGGHNGLKSMIQHLRSNEFPRLRVGVGAPRDPSVQVDFVLSRFSKADREIVDESIERAVSALEDWLKDDIEQVMNRYNGTSNKS
jgi:PTH1 family peptidyl-tRNA hydrolase